MPNKSAPGKGVVIMTYGSATTADHVREYFRAIYGGRASEELIKDFEERYRIVGRSPLIDITVEQARLLEAALGPDHVVRAGMRHSAPAIADAVAECRAAGAEQVTGIVLSPQFSPVIMEGYRTAFADAAKRAGFEERATAVAGPWSTEPHFIKLLAARTGDALRDLRAKHSSVPVVFTTHSLPKSVVDKDPSYLDQLTATIDAVRAELGATIGEWYAGYQSAGHTPEPWLKPDLTDILDRIAGKAKAVLIVPIQFLADHLEILYDLDVAARAQCAERGVEYHRIELPNTDPLFIAALKHITEQTEECL